MQNFMKTILSAMKTWTKKEIKNNIVNSTADWNQNDSNAVDYVKNRTHWEENQHIVLVPETTVSLESYTPAYNPFSINFVEGQTYKVTWDGTTYSCVAYIAEGPDIPSIGNGYIGELSGGNNEPFFCAIFEGEVLLFANSTGTHTISISEGQTIIHKLDSKYLDLPTNLATIDDVFDVANNKMDKSNPIGTGSFSMNRKSGTTVGTNSVATGSNTTASGQYSHAEGRSTTASGNSSHAEGYVAHTLFNIIASGTGSHAEGCPSASGLSNGKNIASGDGSHAEGAVTTASGNCSHAEGINTTASGDSSHAEGRGTTAQRKSQHVQGEYNILDTVGSATTRGKYAHIVGNGTDTERSNAHTLDWNGVGWFQGGLQVGGNAQDDGARNVLLEGNAYDYFVLNDANTGTPYKIQIIDGNLVSSAMTTETTEETESTT